MRSKGELTGPSPVDRGKPGSKIHVLSERGGLPLHVDVSAANVNDHRMLEDMVDGVRPVRQPVGRPRKRPVKLHGDKGYDSAVDGNTGYGVVLDAFRDDVKAHAGGRR